MLRWKQLLLGELFMKVSNDVPIGGRRAGGRDLGDQMGSIGFTGRGEMDFVAGPGRAFLAAVARFDIIG